MLGSWTVQRLHSLLQQVDRQAVDALLELRIGDRPVAADHRDPVALCREDPVVETAQGNVFPVAPRSVTRRELGGKWGDANKPAHSAMVSSASCDARWSCRRPSSEIR